MITALDQIYGLCHIQGLWLEKRSKITRTHAQINVEEAFGNRK
jgi:hypothetical protein